MKKLPVNKKKNLLVLQYIKKKIKILYHLQIRGNYSVSKDYQKSKQKANKYLLKPKITLEELEKFEKKFRIQLPEEYRLFLLQVENGGIGPQNGLFSLGEGLQQSPKGIQNFFPLTRGWFCGKKTFEEYFKGIKDYEHYKKEKAVYDIPFASVKDPGSFIHQGLLLLADLGGGNSSYLVVTGHERGKVWNDFSVNDGGMWPTGKTFLQWYTEWLDKTIVEIKYQHKEYIKVLDSRIKKYPLEKELWTMVQNKSDLELEKKKIIFEKVLKSKQVSGEALVELIIFFLKEKNLKRLALALDKALHAEFYYNPELYVWMVCGYVQLNKFSKIFSLLEKAQEHITYPVIRGYIDLASIYRACNDRQQYMVVVEMNKHNTKKKSVDEIFQVGFAYNMLGEGKNALRCFKSKRIEGLDTDNYKENIAHGYYNSRKYYKALSVLNKVEENEWNLNLKGCVYDKLKDYKKALHYFKKSFQLDYWLVSYDNMGDQYTLLGKYAKAKSIFDELLECNPEYEWTYYHRAAWYAVQGKNEEAMRDVTSALEKGMDYKTMKEDVRLQLVLKKYKIFIN